MVRMTQDVEAQETWPSSPVPSPDSSKVALSALSIVFIRHPSDRIAQALFGAARSSLSSSIFVLQNLFSGMTRIGEFQVCLGRTEEQVHRPAAAENQQIQPENHPSAIPERVFKKGKKRF
ncbi:hypothetical protein AVEN_274179-1 [Araneus ventricosus]|uniref:Uncharacterized protein n=1 Tax=Araneus ventricosus TaxID=182803 RepID=A0A4Y2AT79_ARAVE|nr:hypothetical protein AVEN_274179-1 [Araneus ventricosus]